MSVSYYI